MKKTLFLAVMAGAALAGCVKNEPIVSGDGSPGRITFDAPVVNVPTRAEEIFGNYPGDKDFAVYALYHEGAYNANSFTAPTSATYMTNVTCAADNEDNPTYWAPATDYYWPKNGLLTFAAYAPVMTAVPAEDPGTAVGVKWGATGFTFQNFEVNDDPTQQIDLLYSSRVYDQNKSAMVEDQPYDGVTIPFKHALSSIVFKAKTQEDYSGNATIKLTGIKVNKVVKKGTFAQNLTADRDGGSNAPAWTLDATIAGNVKDSYTVFSLTAGKELTSDEVYVNGSVDEEDDTYGDGSNPPADPTASNDGVRRSDLILIPQSFSRGDEETDKVTVTIEYSIQNGNEAAVPQTHTFQFATVNQGQTDAWEMGKRYTYNIVIGLDKIYFNPQVTNWEDVPGDAIQIN